MNMIIELTVVALIFAFILFIARTDIENRYEYVEEKDEDGNIVEKVIDLKDKGEE